MTLKWICTALFLSFLIAGSMEAASVYYWTDENGVRHYSNIGVNDDNQDAEIRFEEIAPEVNRSEPEDGVETKVDEGIEEPEAGVPGKDAPVVSGDEEIDARMAARIVKERRRLENEIKRIEGLAIGTSFTPGMKDAQIRPLVEQLALLDADPKRYFRMKNQGAFGDATGSTANEDETPTDSITDEKLLPQAPSTGMGSFSEGDSDDQEEPAEK
jgi:hypothetical protein